MSEVGFESGVAQWTFAPNMPLADREEVCTPGVTW